jgi:hypothetical protein
MVSKRLIGIGVMILGIILVVIAGCSIPEITELSIPTNDVQIDENTTAYTIKGVSEPNASITIYSLDIPYNVTADENGNFEYKLQIPVEATILDVKLIASKLGKIQALTIITINRPITPLELNAEPISPDGRVTVNGVTDPHAAAVLNSQQLNLTRGSVNLDIKSDGTFAYSTKIPSSESSVKIAVISQSKGKRVNSKTITLSK